MRKIRTILISMVLLFISMQSKTQSLSNTVWAYTQRMYGLENIEKVTSLFVFTSQSEVIWLFETPRNYMFPVGIGSYDVRKHVITFSHTKPAHKKISLYYGDEDINFEFNINQNNKATLRLCNVNTTDKRLQTFYNDGAICNLSKEKYALQPNSSFIGTSWKIENGTDFIYFKSKYEVLIGGESHLYVSFGNNMFIKSGDNLHDENVVGVAVNNNKLFLVRDGLGVLSSDERYQEQVKFKKIE